MKSDNILKAGGGGGVEVEVEEEVKEKRQCLTSKNQSIGVR